MLRDHGLEAVFFDRYLWFTTQLFGYAALVLTPAVASYNFYLGGGARSDLDKLDRLGWTNLSTRNASHYWFYVALVLCFAAYVQAMIAQELQKALMMRSRIVADHATPGDTDYFIAVRGLPKHMRTENAIRAMCEKWHQHVRHVAMLRPSRKLGEVQKRRRQCVRAIERHESIFIATMLSRRKKDPAGFSTTLRKCLGERYSPSAIRLWAALDFTRHIVPDAYRSVSSLYEELLHLSRDLSRLSAESSESSPVSAIITVADYHIARELVQSSAYIDRMDMEMRCLGTCPSHIVVANVLRAPRASHIISEAVSLVRLALIVLWTIPMGATGVLNQLSSATSLLQEVSVLHLPPYTIGLLQGVVPQVASSFLMLVMVELLKILASWQHTLSIIDEQRSINSPYFLFLFSQLFFTTSMSSGLISTALNMLNRGLAQLPRTLAQNLPLAGTYYVAYLPLQAASGLALTVLRIRAVLAHAVRQSTWQSPRDKMANRASRYSDISWGVMYPLPTTITSIGESPMSSIKRFI